MGNLKIFDPTTTAKAEKIDFVPRPKSLRNLRIGLVDNTKFNSDKLLIKIAAILEKEYGAKNHIIRRKNKSALKKALKQCARLCVDLNLIDGNTLFVDGTKINANAGIKNNWTKKRWLWTTYREYWFKGTLKE